MADWGIIKKLIQHVWPKNDWGTKQRVLLALALLIGGKVCVLLARQIASISELTCAAFASVAAQRPSALFLQSDH